MNTIAGRVLMPEINRAVVKSAEGPNPLTADDATTPEQDAALIEKLQVAVFPNGWPDKSPDRITATGTPGGLCPSCFQILPVCGYCPSERGGCGWNEPDTTLTGASDA